MNKPSTPLTRTCPVCGLEKPIAAFLQLSGKQGTMYGSICSTCRSAGARPKAATPDTDTDEGGGGVGKRIDTNAKTQIETDAKSLDKHRKDSTQKETKKIEETKRDQLERKDLKEKEEKKLREEIKETKKKSGFLDTRDKKISATLPGLITDRQQQNAEAQKIEKGAELEKKMKSVDTSQLYLDSQFGELKFQSEVFKRFKDWLGTGANFRVMEKLYSKTPNNKNQPDNKNSKEPLVDFIEKTDKPSSKRGR